MKSQINKGERTYLYTLREGEEVMMTIRPIKKERIFNERSPGHLNIHHQSKSLNLELKSPWREIALQLESRKFVLKLEFEK